MKRLPEEAKRFIVQCLACYWTPSEVAEAVNVEFGIQVERQAVQKYDPTKSQGEKLSVGLKTLFGETRKRFDKSDTRLPVSSRNYRLERLQRMIERNMQRKNDPLAAQLLEQAAKEVGGFYTNKVRVQVKDKRERLSEILRVPKEQLPEEKTVVH